MIVNRKDAEAAWELLARGIGTRDPTPLDEVTEALISSRYRYCSLFTHPDREGGTMEQFAAVDRAKHVLLNWLKRTPDGRPTLEPDTCPRCEGSGFVRVQKGFTSMRAVCGMCKGTGDTSYDHDKLGE